MSRLQKSRLKDVAKSSHVFMPQCFRLRNSRLEMSRLMFSRLEMARLRMPRLEMSRLTITRLMFLVSTVSSHFSSAKVSSRGRLKVVSDVHVSSVFVS